MTNVGSEHLRKDIKKVWTFAAQHAADYFDEKPCEHEFASVVLTAVKDPVNVWEERYKPALFLGFAPNVSHGYFVMNEEGKVDITSNVKAESQLKDDSEHFDGIRTKQVEQEEAVDPFDPFQPGEEQNVYSCPACRGRHRGHTRDERCRLAAMDLGEETIADIEDGELSYERLPDELKEVGQIPVPLKDVRNSIGRYRE